ncbi:DUF47 family protein [Candidatus Micrarchaeota archaeon]|nr:DUF47 family protein [Candidatus Micrarchaeota archaeon]
MPLKALKRLILPHDALFFDLMLKQAQTAHAASQTLSVLLHDYADVEKTAAKIRDFEHEGDQQVRDVYTALRTTFIVPIDHSDISLLSGALDDVTDIIDHMSATLVAYRITKPTPVMAQLAEVLARQTGALEKAVAAIRDSKTYGDAAAHCKEVKRLEDEADALYTAAIGELFKSNDAVEIIKQKDVLSCLEMATDKTDKASQIVSDIILKHA